MFRNWAALNRSQWWSREALIKSQEEKFSEIANYAYNTVPFYRRLYDSSKVGPADISYGMIRRLPFVTRRNLSETPVQDRTAAGIDVSKCRPYRTSGSTGTPVTVLDDQSFAAEQEIAHLRAYSAGGVRPWNKICTVWGARASMPPLSDRLGFWNTIEGKFHRRIFGNDINDHVKVYSVWKPDVLIAPPSYFKALLWFAEHNLADLSFKLIITSGELLDEITRKNIRDKFQADVIDYYGLTEVGIVSWECPAHCGYHINAESVLVEFIVDEGQVATGGDGRVFVTSLKRRATPIIRYFTGDVATLSDDECPCGRGLPLMKNIQGRIMDFVLTADGKHLSPYAIISRVRGIEGVENFKLTQEDDLSIDVQFRTRSTETGTILRDLHNLCRELFGGVPVNVELVEEVEGERGPKFRPVESHRAKSGQ
jgi:phenylacetate-CoA ligase